MGKLFKPEIVRCPYCVEDANFKVMVSQPGGDWYLCGHCGHLALPSSPLFHCTCSKCVGLERRQGNLTHSSSSDDIPSGLRSAAKTLGRPETPPGSKPGTGKKLE